MNCKTWTRIIALTLFAALALPLQLAAMDNAERHHHHKHHHYQLVDMGTLGGAYSYVPTPWPSTRDINSRGLAVAFADTSIPDPFAPNYCFQSYCLLDHAITWQNGAQTDLGALPGSNNSIPLWINDRGDVVGVSENGVIDPLTGFPEFVGVLWKDGQILDPFTLGGNVSYPNSINNRGQVVGAALNTIPDSYAGSIEPPVFGPGAVTTQFRAFLWQDGVMRDLGTLGNGNDAGADYINERGQVAGVSYTNATPNPTTGIPTLDPFFWENGTMVDIGTLGGTIGLPNWMNNRGQVAGWSASAGDQASFAFLWDRKSGLRNLGTLTGGAFSGANSINDAGEVVGFSDSPNGIFAVLWKKGAIINLGTVDGDLCSEARSINSQGQILGASKTDCFNESHWLLWENGGPSVDLQTLVPPDSGVILANAVFINDRGEMEGYGVLPNGNFHAVLLIPCDENHPGVEGCDYSMVDAATAAAQSTPRPYVAGTTQNLSRSRWSNRFHMRGLPSTSK